MDVPCEVYLIECQGMYKIGVSSGPILRRSQLQGGCPFRLSLIHTVGFVSFSYAEKAEKELHEKFKNYKIRGEWFNAPMDEIISAMNKLQFGKINETNQ